MGEQYRVNLRINKVAILMLLVAFIMMCCTCALAEGEFPQLNDAGFLDEGEFVYENAEEGVWRYCSTTLKVEIYRYDDTENKQVWFEAEVWSTGGEIFRMIPYNEEKWLTSTAYPAKIAKKNGTVLAINSDYAHTRSGSKMGIIIRNGVIYSKKTKAKNSSGFPNLDTLAIFPDGDMQVFYSDELTAQEYLDMGAIDVLAFGPLLIRDWELNEAALAKYGTSKAPRTAIGMVEPGHYFAMMLEGRQKTAKGAGISFLAEKMYEKGCQVAFNLDGGQTSTMVFMGKQIITVGNTESKNASARKTADILGIGTSALVLEEE